MLCHRPWSDWKTLLADVALPALIIDIDAVDHNLDVLLDQCAADVTVRLATKSIRCAAVMERLHKRGRGRVKGVMTYHVGEVSTLHASGINDMLCGYPVGRWDDALAVARWWRDHGQQGGRLIPMADCTQHVDLFARAAAEMSVEIPLCIDVDVSLRPAPGVHLGVRRSPVRTAEQALEIARFAHHREGVRICGVMAYEAQVAGLPDHVPGQTLLDPIRRLIKSRSTELARNRRAEVIKTLENAGFSLDLVNGGGTGSVATTSGDGTCTEVTAGSGFLCPTLFDHYDGLGLRPAAFFALPVVRHSDPGFVTCGFGGFVASGPTQTDRAPVVHRPRDLHPLGMEGFGEVQTPFKLGPRAPQLGLGDPVICRHAKAGELLAHFAHAHLAVGGKLTSTVPTYPRWLGQ